MVTARERSEKYNRFCQLQNGGRRLGFHLNTEGIGINRHAVKNNGILIALGYLSIFFILLELPKFIDVLLPTIGLLFFWFGLAKVRKYISDCFFFLLYRSTLELILAELRALSFALWGEPTFYLPSTVGNELIDSMIEREIEKSGITRDRLSSERWLFDLPYDDYVDPTFGTGKKKGPNFKVAFSLVKFEFEELEWSDADSNRNADCFAIRTSIIFKNCEESEVVLESNFALKYGLPKSYQALKALLGGSKKQAKKAA